MAHENVDNGFRQTGSTDNTLFIGGVDVKSTATELDECYVTVDMTDISTSGSMFVASPVAGNITKIQSIINGAITVADATITAEIGGVAVTGSSITIDQATSAAGIVDSSTPTAANAVAVGSAIEIISNGGSTDVCRATFTITIQRT